MVLLDEHTCHQSDGHCAPCHTWSLLCLWRNLLAYAVLGRTR